MSSTLLNTLNEEGVKDLSISLFLYIITLILSYILLYYYFMIEKLASVILALIISWVFLIFIFLPSRLDFWKELDSATCLYTFILFITPFILIVYVSFITVKKKRV